MNVLKKIGKMLLALGIVLILLAVAGYVYENGARKKDISEYPPPGKMISVGTHRLHLDCRGTVKDNLPIIILEAGLDPLGSLSWSKVHDSLAVITRTCAYDRAGIAWSDHGPEERDGNQISEELKMLLSEAGEKGPYVFVSHSMGGPYSMTFFDKFKEDVAGLILVESTHPEQFKRLPADLVRKPPPKFVLQAVPFLPKNRNHTSFHARPIELQ